MFRESSTPRKEATRIQSKMVNQDRKERVLQDGNGHRAG